MAFAQKNPKNQAEALNWLANAMKEFGFAGSVSTAEPCIFYQVINESDIPYRVLTSQTITAKYEMFLIHSPRNK